MTSQILPTEIEIKFRVADRGAFEQKLRDLGGVAGPREFETNMLFDDRAGSLRGVGKILRLRRTEGRGLLTFKGPKTIREGVRSRREIETHVEHPGFMKAILEAVGFEPNFRYDKYRTVWELESNVEIVVDETPVGLFAEIEGGEVEILDVAARLGVTPDEFITESYVALYMKAREENPSLPLDMVFE